MDAPPRVEDIFLDADPVSSVAPTGLRPSASGVPNFSAEPAASALPRGEGASDARSSRGWLLAAIGVVVAGGLVIFLAFRMFSGSNGSTSIIPAPSPSPTVPSTSPFTLPDVASNPPQGGASPSTAGGAVASRPKDTDQDGVSDDEEVQRGSDPTLADTDADGLTDYDEIVVFGTDPKQADTDGDGYLDGDEVRNGYHPKGPGKLLDLEAALQSNTQTVK